MSGPGKDLTLLERAKVAAATGATVTLSGEDLRDLLVAGRDALRRADAATARAEAWQERAELLHQGTAAARLLNRLSEDKVSEAEEFYRRGVRRNAEAIVFALLFLAFLAVRIIL